MGASGNTHIDTHTSTTTQESSVACQARSLSSPQQEWPPACLCSPSADMLGVLALFPCFRLPPHCVPDCRITLNVLKARCRDTGEAWTRASRLSRLPPLKIMTLWLSVPLSIRVLGCPMGHTCCCCVWTS